MILSRYSFSMGLIHFSSVKVGSSCILVDVIRILRISCHPSTCTAPKRQRLCHLSQEISRIYLSLRMTKSMLTLKLLHCSHIFYVILIDSTLILLAVCDTRLLQSDKVETFLYFYFMFLRDLVKSQPDSKNCSLFKNQFLNLKMFVFADPPTSKCCFTKICLGSYYCTLFGVLYPRYYLIDASSTYLQLFKL
jgi:hypothetical protein